MSTPNIGRGKIFGKNLRTDGKFDLETKEYDESIDHKALNID